MEENRKINKRPRSITEFRTAYSDSKNNFNSTDRHFRRQALIKYVLIAVFLAVIALAGFLVTDALLTISEEPYVPEETTTAPVEEESTTGIDKKYFENQVTVKADSVEDNQSDDVRE